MLKDAMSSTIDRVERVNLRPKDDKLLHSEICLSILAMVMLVQSLKNKVKRVF